MFITSNSIFNNVHHEKIAQPNSTLNFSLKKSVWTVPLIRV